MTASGRKIAIIAPKMYPVLKRSDIDTFGGAEVALALVARHLSQDGDLTCSSETTDRMKRSGCRA
jgi:hypothetical protein